MEITPELMEKAKEATNVEELVQLARENGVELTAEEAERYYAQLHASGELSDDELDNVSGGCGGEPKKEIYEVGDWVEYYRYREAGMEEKMIGQIMALDRQGGWSMDPLCFKYRIEGYVDAKGYFLTWVPASNVIRRLKKY